MKILAFDTSSIACTVALQNGDDIKSLHQIAPMQHAKLILPMIKELLETFSLSLNQLDAIAFGCGPGSFTGIRIASSVVQGLGFATHLPIIPVSSLAVIAQTAFIEQQWSKLLVALDARMEQIYWATYRVNQEGLVEAINAEQILTPEEIKIANPIMDSSWSGVGDGWDKYRERLIKSIGFQPDHMNAQQLPHARAMLKIAAVKLAKGDIVKPSDAIPVYLR